MPNSITATKSRMSGESALPPWGQDLVGPSPLESKAGGHAHPHIWSAPDCRRWWSAKSCQKTRNQPRVTKDSRRSPRMGGYDLAISRSSAKSFDHTWQQGRKYSGHLLRRYPVVDLWTKESSANPILGGSGYCQGRRRQHSVYRLGVQAFLGDGSSAYPIDIDHIDSVRPHLCTRNTEFSSRSNNIRDAQAASLTTQEVQDPPRLGLR